MNKKNSTLKSTTMEALNVEAFFFSSTFLSDLFNLYENSASYKQGDLEKEAINSKNIKEYVLNKIDLIVFSKPEFKKIRPNLNTLFRDFYLSIVQYLNDNNKIWSAEYIILKKYWKFMDLMKKNNIKSFNKFIIFLNEKLYHKQKGFLNG